MSLEVIRVGDQVPINKIRETAQKVRRETADQGIDELLASLLKHGQIHAVSLIDEGDGTYTLANGHRRLVAAQRGRLPALRANIYKVPEGQEAERERLIQEHLYAANLAEPLLPIEKARMFDLFMRDFGFTAEQVADCFEDETTETVLDTMKFLNIDDTVLDIVAANPGKFTEAHLRVLADAASASTSHAWRMKPAEQVQVARELVEQVDKQVVRDPRKFQARIRSVVRERREREKDKNLTSRKALTDPVKSLFKAIETVQNNVKNLKEADIAAIKEIDASDKGMAIKMLYDVIGDVTTFIDDRLAKLPTRKAAS